jgi:hypothetical protein
METRSTAVSFPLRLERYGHGDLIAHNAQELASYEGMGWVPRPDTPPAYELFPMWLKGGEGMPDLLVENEAEAKAATRRGYRLPSDDVIEGGKDAFAQAYEPEDEDYEPERYPLRLRHPDHRDAVPMRWRYYPGPGGHAQATAIPPVPEHLPDVEVSSAVEEIEWTKRGWTIGSQFAQEAAVAREASDPTETSRDHEEPISASPPSIVAARKRPSGAQWRKRRREQMPAEQPEVSQ